MPKLKEPAALARLENAVLLQRLWLPLFMKWKVFLVVLLLCISGSFGEVYAQKYVTALGGRLAKNDFGLTLQQKVLPKTTLEALAVVRQREVAATVLAEQHFPVLGRRFNYYVGGGAHLGAMKDFGATYGLDGIMGLEFSLYPVNISADLKPSVHIRHENWFDLSTGISVRYILVKEKKKKFRLFGKEKDSGKDGFRFFNRARKEEEEKKRQEQKPFNLFRKKEDKSRSQEKKPDKQQQEENEDRWFRF